jgi:GGDEF domain-containing protein
VVVLDLVGFGTIDNDFGHLDGDLVLKVVARRLSQVIRDRRHNMGLHPTPVMGFDHDTQRSVELTDITSRYGGDEFLFLLLQREPRGNEAALRAQKNVSTTDWLKGPEVRDVVMEDATRTYLNDHPLNLRAGVVDFELPIPRPSVSEARRIVDKLFKCADTLMRKGKKDRENPIFSVTAKWQRGRLVEVTEVTRVVS